MQLATRALIDYRICAERMGLDDDDQPESLVPMINYASSVVVNYISRPLIYAENVARTFDSMGDGLIFFPFKPVHEISSVRFDTSRVWGDDTEIPFYHDAEMERIFVDAQPRAAKAYRVVSSDGFSIVNYRQSDEPLEPVAGETWLHSGIFERYDGTVWVACDVEPMDELIESAVAEYVAYIRVRMRAGGAGLAKLERGYSFEGSAVAYELSMPQHVKDALAPLAVMAI